MNFELKIRNIGLLIFSIVCIYLLAPTLDKQMGMLVSAAFATTMILSSKIYWDAKHIIKYVVYISVAMLCYYILFNDQPWEFLTKEGEYDSSALPLIVTSVMMSINGWLLLSGRHDRIVYTVVTLGIQIPLALTISSDCVQHVLMHASEQLQYKDNYAVSLQTWQFLWMMNYYLPIYFLKHLKGSR